VSAFEPESDNELQRLRDEELIAYIARARDHGDLEAAGRGLAILVFGHWSNVERRVRMKVPDAHVEDVTGAIIVSAIQSAFSGMSVGEFVKWLARITQRRIADFHRKPRVDVVALAGGEDDEDGPRERQLEGASEEGYVELRDAIERVLDRLSARDQQVIELRIFEDLLSAEVAERLGLTVANVDKIVSRFRRALRRALDDDGDTSS